MRRAKLRSRRFRTCCSRRPKLCKFAKPELILVKPVPDLGQLLPHEAIEPRLLFQEIASAAFAATASCGSGDRAMGGQADKGEDEVREDCSEPGA